MNTNNTNTAFNKVIFAFFVSILIISAVIFALAILSDNGREVRSNDLAKITLVGSYRINDGEYAAFDSKAEFDLHKGDIFNFKGRLKRDIEKNKTVSVHIMRSRTEIRVNGNIVLLYGKIGKKFFNTGIGEVWTTFTSPGISRDDKIEITLVCGQSMNSYELGKFINNMYSGYKYNLFGRLCAELRIQLMLSVFLIAFGLILLFFLLCMARHPDLHLKRDVYIAALIICAGIWSLINYRINSFIIPNSVLSDSLVVFTQSAIPFLFGLYLLNDNHRKVRFIIEFICAVSGIALAVFLVLYLSGLDFGLIMQLQSIMLLVLTLLFSVAILLDYRSGKNRLSKLELVGVAVILIGAVFETLSYIFHILPNNVFGLVMFAFVVIYIFHIILLIKTSIEKVMYTERLENELLQSRMKLMQSQMKPHFIFNTLNTIRSFCSNEPKKASGAICDFSDYLRANFNALTEKSLVCFSEELQHTKKYAELEKLRFDDRVNIFYDIGYMKFPLPPLTLQPLVENAVKHGICKKEEGGTVTVKTEKLKRTILITVTDDGVGFDVYKTRVKSVTLDNIEARLRHLCSGELKINSAEGFGTSVRITLPYNEEEISDENYVC